ncbi:MAG: DUF1778 domain-containing protein [Pseudonocardiaceae bacterium]
MPGDSSIVTFRLSVEERDLLEAVAHYSGETLSAFVRFTMLSVARDILREVGPEAVTQGDENFEAQRHTKAHRRLKDRIKGLEKHATGERHGTTRVADR